MKTQFVSLDDLERDEAPPIVPRQAARNIRFKAFKDIQISTAARYIVKGIVPSSGLVVVWGEPKCGKSFFVFDMVAHVAAGWEYRGHRVQQCPAVYFALEGAEGSRRCDSGNAENGGGQSSFRNQSTLAGFGPITGSQGGDDD